MERIISYKVNSDYEGKKISEFLRDNYYSAKLLTKLRHTDNSIRLNEQYVFMNSRLKAGDKVEIIYSETPEPSSIVPVKLSFEIIYEDEDIMVINKPANMPVHPSINNYENTLANAIAYYFNSKNQSFTFRCINRLDKDTTGLLIVAKHQLSAAILSHFMKAREIKREYLAIADGIFENKSGTVNKKIGRVNSSLIERCIDNENGEEAITHYEVIDEFPVKKLLNNANNNVSQDEVCTKYASLLRIHLDTGRTHQIRVHMKHLGHPLIGDRMYNNTENHFTRQALHSYSLTFLHPVTLQEMHFEQEMIYENNIFSPRSINI